MKINLLAIASRYSSNSSQTHMNRVQNLSKRNKTMQIPEKEPKLLLQYTEFQLILEQFEQESKAEIEPLVNDLPKPMTLLKLEQIASKERKWLNSM
jgi:hypothetical protein